MTAVDGVSTVMALTAVPVTFRAGVLRVDLALIRQAFNDYCAHGGARGKSELAEVSRRVGFVMLFDKDLLRSNDGYVQTVTEEMLLATRSLVLNNNSLFFVGWVAKINPASWLST